MPTLPLRRASKRLGSIRPPYAGSKINQGDIA